MILIRTLEPRKPTAARPVQLHANTGAIGTGAAAQFLRVRDARLGGIAFSGEALGIADGLRWKGRFGGSWGGAGLFFWGYVCESMGEVLFGGEILFGGKGGVGGMERTLVVGLLEQRAAQATAASFAHLHRWDWGVRGILGGEIVDLVRKMMDLRLRRRRDSSRGGIHMLVWRGPGAVGPRGDRRLSFWSSVRDFLSL